MTSEYYLGGCLIFFSWGYTCVDMKSLILAERPDVISAKLRTAKVLKRDDSEDLFLDTIYIGAHATVTDIEGKTLEPST